MHREMRFNYLECKNLTHRLFKNRLPTGCGPWVPAYTLCPVLVTLFYLPYWWHSPGPDILRSARLGLLHPHHEDEKFSAQECFLVFFVEVSQPPLCKARHTVDGEGSVCWPVDRLALEDPETARWKTTLTGLWHLPSPRLAWFHDFYKIPKHL